MKKYITLLLVTFASIALQAQNLVGGCWMGVVEQAYLPLTMTFSLGEDSSMIPVVYSPLQQEAPLPCTKYRFENDTLVYSAKSLALKMQLRYDSLSNTFSGVMIQGISRFEMVFKPTEGLWRPNRPQTPQSPYGYISEDFVVEGKNGVSLAGTITRPNDNLPHPAVLLVSGSGQQNRDEEIGLHKPFLVLADYLTRNGIVVMRYDDRGMGESKGDYKNATTLDFASDAELLFKFLRKQSFVDKKQVGILGHSEGGAIAPIVAARNKKVSFVVMMAGQGCSGAEVLMLQNRAIFELNGYPAPMVDDRVDLMRKIFSIVGETPDNELNGAIKKMIEEEHFSSSYADSLGFSPSAIFLMTQQLSSPWMRMFIKLDPKDYLPYVKCPILAVNGNKDCQVIADPNLKSIEYYTKQKAKTVLMPGLNHLFQHCESGSVSEYMLIEETLAPEFMECVRDWILNHNELKK